MVDIELDITWKNPGQAQLDALAHAQKYLGVSPKTQFSHHMFVLSQAIGRSAAADAGVIYKDTFSVYDLAELMIMAPRSLWYTQAQSWCAGNTGALPKEMKLAGEAITQVVEWGYQDGKWWDIDAIWPDVAQRVLAMSFVLEAARLTRDINQHTLMLYSSGFQQVPRMMIPKLKPDVVYKYLATNPAIAMLAIRMLVDKKFSNINKKQMLADAEKNLKPCINPFCTKGANGTRATVNLAIHSSGACCRACMNYECTHPDCVKRAVLNGWSRATHPWGTKIAEAHKEYRKHED